MTNTTTTRQIKRVAGQLTHSTGVKLTAVKRVNTLIRNGMSQTKALSIVAKDHGVRPQTVQNWRKKYDGITMHNNNTTSPLVRPDNSHSAYQLDKFSVESVNLITSDGVNIRLKLDDLKAIATLAGSFC